MKQSIKKQAGHVRVQAAKCTRCRGPSAVKCINSGVLCVLRVRCLHGSNQLAKASALRSLARRSEHGKDDRKTTGLRQGDACLPPLPPPFP